MKKSIFKTEITLAPRVNATGSELTTMPLGWALVTNKWKSKVEALRAETDTEKRAELKKALPCITPGGVFSHISEKGLTKASGYLCADIDCKPEKGINPGLENYDLKTAVARLPYVAYCGLSCGGKGYFLIIPIADTAKYKDYYRALMADFMRAGIILDAACSNIAFKRFVSWDDNPYINTNAQPYAYTLPERKRPTGGTQATPEETRAKVEDIISRCEAEEINITEDYKDWTDILFSLATEFGFDGEDYAHRISAIDSRYTYDETHHKYNELLASNRGGITIGTFFHIAREKMGTHDFIEIQD